MNLANRNAIVTGGSQGLGRAIAEAFVRAGASVLLCARDHRAADATAAELQALAPLPGQRVLGQGSDVSSPERVEALFGAAAAFFDGPLHILVNNAGVQGPTGPTDEITFDEWQRCLAINLHGTFLPCQTAARRFKASGYGKIINLSGGGATGPRPNFTAYAVSKTAVVRLTENLAVELQPFHVDVNAVAPGALNTRMLDEVLAAGPAKVGEATYHASLEQSRQGGVPLGLGAELCAYLASAESDGVTGKLISAKWDPWKRLHEHRDELNGSDIYALRRITPEDRGKSWPLEGS